MINKVILIGNLGQEPETRIFEGGAEVTRLSLATNKRYQQDDEWKTKTEWHNVVAWRKSSEIAKALKKGMLVYIEGEIQYREWTKEDGTKGYITDIVAQRIRRLSKLENNVPFMPDQEPVMTNQIAMQSSEPLTSTQAEGTVDDLPF